jgi:hypothetical protein
MMAQKKNLPYYLPSGSKARPVKSFLIRMFDDEFAPFKAACKAEGVTRSHALWALIKWFGDATAAERRAVLGDERSPGMMERGRKDD